MADRINELLGQKRNRVVQKKSFWKTNSVFIINLIVSIFILGLSASLFSFYWIDKMNRIILTYSNAFILQETLYPISVVTVYKYHEDEGTTNIMASGKAVYKGALAISRDFVETNKLMFGDSVYLENIGYYKVEDIMNAQHRSAVDIYEPDWNAMKKFGNKKSRLFLVVKNER